MYRDCINIHIYMQVLQKLKKFCIFYYFQLPITHTPCKDATARVDFDLLAFDGAAAAANRDGAGACTGAGVAADGAVVFAPDLAVF